MESYSLKSTFSDNDIWPLGEGVAPRPVSESERDFSRERATLHTSESKRAKFKTAHDFLCATACNASRVLAIVEASVCLSVRRHTLRFSQNGASSDHESFNVGCHKLDFISRIRKAFSKNSTVSDLMLY